MRKENAIQLVKQYLELVKKRGISIEKCFLYGSYATNTANRLSDIDFIIISNLFSEKEGTSKYEDLLWKLTMRVDPRLEPRLLSKESFESGIVDDLALIEIV